MAFFPAEVLVSPYRTLGDVREILVIASISNDVLIFTVAAMLFLALASLRRRRYAVLASLVAIIPVLLIFRSPVAESQRGD